LKRYWYWCLIGVVLLMTACRTVQAGTQQPPGKEWFTIEHDPDIAYTTGQVMDVYAPVEDGAWPIVLIVHGAGYDKLKLRGLAVAMSERGFVVGVPDYNDVDPRKGIPELGCAARLIASRAEDYGADVERMVVLSHSFGGYAGAALALSKDETLFPDDTCTAQADIPTSIGLVGISGFYVVDSPVLPPNTEFVNQHVTIRLTYGTDEDSSVYDEAKAFYDTLAATDHDVQLLGMYTDHAGALNVPLSSDPDGYATVPDSQLGMAGNTIRLVFDVLR